MGADKDGIGAIGSAGVGMGMGIANSVIGGAIQKSQNESLMRQNMKYQKEMGKYNSDLAFEQWNRTNAGAQVKHYEDAGLNVGMMYGGTGAGGATAQTGASGTVNGATANDNSAVMGMGIQNAMQLALMEAQKENIEADTQNKLTDAGYKGGVQTDNTTADTESKQLANQWERFMQEKDSQGESLKEKGVRVDINKMRADISKIDAEILTIPEYLKLEAEKVKQGAQRIVIEARNATTAEQRNVITERIAELERGLRLKMQGAEMNQKEQHQGDQKGMHNDRMDQQTADRYMRAIEGLFSTAIPWYQRGQGTETITESWEDGHGGKTTHSSTKRK